MLILLYIIIIIVILISFLCQEKLLNITFHSNNLPSLLYSQVLILIDEQLFIIILYIIFIFCK